MRDLCGAVFIQFVYAKSGVSAVLTDLQWIDTAQALHPEGRFVTVPFHIPGKYSDAFEVDVRVVAGPAFADNVPIHLSGNGILHSIDHFDSGIGVFLAVLRDI